MIYTEKFIPFSTNRRPGNLITPTFITVHSTGNPKSTAKNELAWLTNPSNTRTASWHICVDEKEALCAVPLDELAFHAGTNTGNKTSLGIEICESGDRKKTIALASQVLAELLRARNWDTTHLRRHYDWSKKICPRIMSANDWQGWKDFLTLVRKEIKPMAATNTPSPWAQTVWAWAVKEGLFDGKDPKGPVTREQLAAILQRVLKK